MDYLHLAVDTPVGPLYLGLGVSASGSSAAYLFLGLP